MPLPGTRVIHPAWSTHHAPVARGGMTAKCRVEYATGDGDATWNPETEQMEPAAPRVIYDDVCRVQELDTARDVEAAGDPAQVRRYLVALDYAAHGVDTGDAWTVVITQARNDPDLVDLRLAVIDVMRGSERFQRDLICEDTLG